LLIYKSVNEKVIFFITSLQRFHRRVHSKRN